MRFTDSSTWLDEALGTILSNEFPDFPIPSTHVIDLDALKRWFQDEYLKFALSCCTEVINNRSVSVGAAGKKLCIAYVENAKKIDIKYGVSEIESNRLAVDRSRDAVQFAWCAIKKVKQEFLTRGGLPVMRRCTDRIPI